MMDPFESRVSKNYNASTEEALFTYFVPVFHQSDKITDLGTRLFFRLVRRMERLKQMREDMHGKYTELTDEKEIIRMSA
jgi:hypothetical protein